MELGAQHKWMAGHLRNFNERSIRGYSAGLEPGRFKPVSIVVVVFVSMTVTLGHKTHSVRAPRKRAFRKPARVFTQPHCSAGGEQVFLSGEVGDHGIRRMGIEFLRVRPFEPEFSAGVLDHHDLHSEA